MTLVDLSAMRHQACLDDDPVLISMERETGQQLGTALCIHPILHVCAVGDFGITFRSIFKVDVVC